MIPEPSAPPAPVAPLVAPVAAPIAAVVLAAGRGTRMRSDTHKVLHPVGGRPMLGHLLQTLDLLSPERTVVVVGDRADQVRDWLAGRAAIAVQEPQLGTAHAVLQAQDALRGFAGTVLILFGDVPLISAATLARLAAVLDGPAAPGLAVLGFRPAAAGAYGRIILDAHGHVARMVEARDASVSELAEPLCNAGMMAVRSDLLFPLLERVGNGNAAGEYYLPDIVMLANADGDVCRVLEAGADEVQGVNSRSELAGAEAIFQAGRRAELMAAGVTMIAPETVFLSFDTTIGRDCLIEPNVVFGPGVTLADGVTIRAFSHLEDTRVSSGCEVGPFARLRPGTVLGEGAKIGNFVETKNAVLGPGAKANHLTYLGDASIGAMANIGAGTITCNYDGFGKYRTVIGEGAFIGSNSALVAPVTIGDRAIVAAGSAVTQDVEADALAIARPPQVSKTGWAKRFRTLALTRKGK
jgi:bifunctional UDP-N-acetylglucosamine pyrophosphorylase/glucosamine-1-phosphate N-acetyltransferase